MKRTVLFTMLSLALLFVSCKKEEKQQEQPQPATPTLEPLDYTNETNWMIKSKIEHDVDLFFLYPTSTNPYCTTLVSPVDSVMMVTAYKNYLKNGECFSSYTNVFAPYYRQITTVGILECVTPEDLIELDRNNEPWCDVNAALDYYFTNINKDRPVIFASHSQGSANMHIVMDTYMKKHPELKKRIVAIYAIGYRITQEWCESVDFPFAKGEEDYGVIMTWNTEGPGSTDYNLPIYGNTLVINPLNWKCDTTYAGIELNTGSLKENSEGIVEHVDGRSDAQINPERGVIVSTTVPENEYIPANPIFGSKSLHFDDSALFYENMKANGKKRIDAYLAGQR